MKIISNSFNDTLKLGGELASKLKGGDVVLLAGEMGVGKSVFARGVIKGLGIEDDVLSPTFTLMNNYNISHDGKLIDVCHIDAYRIKTLDEAYMAGLGDCIGDSNTICLMEWHKNLGNMVDEKKSIVIEIKRTNDDNKREILFKT